MDGDLLGVNSFILSRSGTSSGVGFAVPAAIVRRVVETAAGGGQAVVRPWLGARTQTVTAEIARSMGLTTPQGALVADIWPGGPAARAGLRRGDVIVGVNGKPAVDAAAVAYGVSSRRPGESIPLLVRRENGREETLTLRAEAPPETPPKDEQQIRGRNPFDGATVVNLSPAVADQLGVDPFLGKGVLVTNIGRGFAMNAGLRPGDLIKRVNGRDIATVRDLVAVLGAGGGAWQVTIERQGQEVTANFRT
jgi:S1-C subfamily serine protease